jgi:hypothetical protein
MKKVFIDDIRYPENLFYGGAGKEWTLDPLFENNTEWAIVRSYDEFVEFIEQNGPIDLVSFDHDLHYEAYLPENQEGEIDYDAMEVKTGYHAAEWLIQYCKENNVEFPEYRVHSMNPQGRRNIEQVIMKFKNQQL